MPRAITILMMLLVLMMVVHTSLRIADTLNTLILVGSIRLLLFNVECDRLAASAATAA